MTQKQMDRLRRVLEAKQADLRRRIPSTRGFLAIPQVGDPLDRGRMTSERETVASSLDHELRLLSGVEEALREMDAGTFGRCACCDRDIPIRRLTAVPWSPYCRNCQESAELRTAEWPVSGMTVLARGSQRPRNRAGCRLSDPKIKRERDSAPGGGALASGWRCV
jgi:DnaK suppressor protein